MPVSQHDIAKAAGVSQRAVSFALNGKPNVSKEKRAEILKVASDLGYRVNASARAMRRRSTGAIGVLVQHYNVGDAFLQGINQRLQELSYHTIIEQFTGVLALNDMPARVMIENVVDGLIIINSDSSIVDLIQNKFSKLMTQTVWLESSYFAAFGCIQRDEQKICERACEHIAKQGFKRVLFVENVVGLYEVIDPLSKDKPYSGGRHYSSYARHDEMEKSCAKFGLKFDLIDSCTRTQQISPQTLARQVQMPDGQLTAVVPFDYRTTEWVFRRLAMAGMVCPKDYGLLALDQLRFFHQDRFWEELTHFTFDRIAAGKMAADMVLDMVKNKKQAPSVRLVGDLIHGETLKR